MGKGRASLAGRVAVITGGASGIGKGFAIELASRGCEVVIADRQMELAAQVVKEIDALGGKGAAAELDVRDAARFVAVAKETAQRAGRIDYLFNNAGIGVGGEMDVYRREDWDDVIDVNLRGVAYGIHAVYPIMIKQGSGHIVNTASMAGLCPAPAQGAYTATKHAVVGLSKALRLEAKRHGVKVSVVCPGVIRTPILTGGKYGKLRVKGLTDDLMMKMWEQMRPMEPAEHARLVIDALERNEAIILEPWYWRPMWYLDRLSPGLSMWVWGQFLGKMRADFEAAGVTPDPAPEGE